MSGDTLHCQGRTGGPGAGHRHLAHTSQGQHSTSHHAQDGPTTKSHPDDVPVVLRVFSLTLADGTDTTGSPQVRF